MTLPVRFACQITPEAADDPVDVARRAEATGFDVVSLGDHVGQGFAPVATLGAVAAATRKVRLGTFVLNATLRNPVQLAWEASTLDRLSNGRVELGLGAGHTPCEYSATGVDHLPARARKQQLAEQVEIVRRLLDGETVDFVGLHHAIAGASVPRSVQERLPILVGGNGERLLRHAGAHADIVGLQGLGRTLADGHRHEVKWSPQHLDLQLRQVQAGAGERFGALEFNALVQVAEVTDDAEQVIRDLAARVEGLSEEDAASSPYVLVGTVDEIAAKIERCRERWGITYFTVRAVETFAPVIAAFR